MSDVPPIGDGNTTTVVRQNPWLGLASFEERHSELFFGRSAEISEMERMVLRSPACLLFGRSGLGKTSLLRAGVFPRLRSKDCVPVYVRLNFAEDAPALVEQVKQDLSKALEEWRIEARPPAPGETLWEYAHREDVDFWDSRVRLVTPVLVFDQFEEVFTLGRRSPAVTASVTVLVDELQALINNSPPQGVRQRFDAKPDLVGEYDFEKRTVKVLIGLREDFLAHFESLRKSFHAAGTNRMRLEPLNGLQAMEAVLKPGHGLVDEPVAQRIVEFVAHDRNLTADAPLNPELMERWVVEPALLSVVCRELNERRRKAGQSKITADLLSSDAKEEILVNFYEQAIGDRPEAVRVFVEDHLLTGAGYRDRASQDDALSEAGVTEESLSILVGRRLLHREETNGVVWLELSHDLLTSVVQQSRAWRQSRQAEAARRKAERTTALYKLVIAGVAAIALGAMFFMYKFHLERARANELVKQASQEDLATAEQLFDEDQWGRGIAYLGRALSLNPSNSDAAVHFWSAVVYGRHGDGRLPEFRTKFSSNASFAVFNPDATRALVATTGGTFIYDTTSRTCLGLLAPAAVRLAAFSPDGKSILTINSSNKVQTWDAATRNIKCTFLGTPNYPLSAGFNSDGSRVVVTGLDEAGRLAGIWKTTFPTNVCMLSNQHKDWVPSAAFSKDGNYVVTAGGHDNSACVWNARTGAALSRLAEHGGWVMAAAFSPDGEMVVTCSQDKTARIWRWRTTKVMAVLQHDGNVLMAGFSPDGARVVTASADGTARIWDATNGWRLTDPLQHRSRVVMAAFSTNDHGARIITRCADDTVHLWNAANGNQLGEPLRHGRGNRLFDAQFMGPDDAKVATVWSEGLGVWNISATPPGLLLSNGVKRVWCARFSPDGEEVVTACGNGFAYVWDVSRGEKKLSLLLGTNAVRYAEFSRDGKLVVAVGEAKFGKIWDARNGNQVRELNGVSGTNYPTQAKFNATGTRVLIAGLDTSARIFNLENSNEPPILLEHKKAVLSACFSTSTNTAEESVLTASLDNSVKIWDARTGTNLGSIFCEGVRYAAFGRDDRAVAIACDNGMVWIAEKTGEGANQRWSTNNSSVLSVPNCKLNIVQFSPDGRFLAAGGDDGTVVVWDPSKTTNYIRAFSDNVNDMEFKKDAGGIFLLAASADRTARLWRIVDDRVVAFCEPFAHQGEVVKATFRRDLQYVATACDDGTCGIWKVPPAVEWGESMTIPIKTRDRICNLGEALTATISGFRFETNSGQIQQLRLNSRLDWNEDLATNSLLDPQWRRLFLWWQTNSQQCPSTTRQPWPQDQ